MDIKSKRLAEQINKLKYNNQDVKFNLGVLILLVLCTFLIVISTFTQIDFKHYIIPFETFAPDADWVQMLAEGKFSKHYQFIPQIPVIMFIALLLGRKYGIISVSLYILIGLFLAPVFALGGGIDYIFQYGFGYILGYVPAIFFAASILRSGLSFRNMLQATIVGVITIHIVGSLYFLFIATIQKETSSFIMGWLVAQSGTKILYDIFFSFIAMICAKFTKKFLWFAIG